MCCAHFIRWMDERFNKGIFKRLLANAVKWYMDNVSPNTYLKEYVRNQLKTETTPPWVSDLYICVLFIIGILLVLLSAILPYYRSMFIAIIALLRPLDILMFTLEWVFLAGKPVHSYRRSLAGFILNIAEVVIYFAAAYIGFGLIKASPIIPTALYSSLRTSVTIGPIATLEPPNCPWAGLIISYQIGITYFLIIIAVAGVVGALRQRGEKNKARPSSESNIVDL